mgnify:CR=1 FL=1
MTYTIDKILSYRKINGTMYAVVSWKGFLTLTLEPYDDIKYIFRKSI